MNFVMQIVSQIKLLSKNSEISVTTLGLIGDVNIDKQIKKIKRNKTSYCGRYSRRIADLIRKKKLLLIL